MRLLLDTHALVWWWTDDDRLPPPARAAIRDPDSLVFVSAASVWEIANKHRLGKWPAVSELLDGFDTSLRRSRFAPLPISHAHAKLAGSLEGEHCDPFDCMLLAQARLEALTLVSADPVFRAFGAAVVW